MKRLNVKLTKEERGYYSNLFELASGNKEGVSKIEGREAADFLKKSGVSKDLLKNIWSISAQTNLSWLERDEFYVALRLIALAQNNMPVEEKSIIYNEPVPPLPKFDLKSRKEVIENNEFKNNQVSLDKKQEENVKKVDFSQFDPLKPQNNSNLRDNMNNNMSNNLNYNPKMGNDINWDLNNEIINKYLQFFEKYKNRSLDKMEIGTILQILSPINIGQETISKIMNLIGKPHLSEGFSFKEIVVIFHIIDKIKNSLEMMPETLPLSLKHFLSFVELGNNEISQNHNDNQLSRMNQPFVPSDNYRNSIDISNNKNENFTFKEEQNINKSKNTPDLSEINIKGLRASINNNSGQIYNISSDVSEMMSQEIAKKSKELFFLQEQIDQDHSILLRLKSNIDNYLKENINLDNLIEEAKEKIKFNKKEINAMIEKESNLIKIANNKREELSNIINNNSSIKEENLRSSLKINNNQPIDQVDHKKSIDNTSYVMPNQFKNSLSDEKYIGFNNSSNLSNNNSTNIKSLDDISRTNNINKDNSIHNVNNLNNNLNNSNSFNNFNNFNKVDNISQQSHFDAYNNVNLNNPGNLNNIADMHTENRQLPNNFNNFNNFNNHNFKSPEESNQFQNQFVYDANASNFNPQVNFNNFQNENIQNNEHSHSFHQSIKNTSEIGISNNFPINNESNISQMNNINMNFNNNTNMNFTDTNAFFKENKVQNEIKSPFENVPSNVVNDFKIDTKKDINFKETKTTDWNNDNWDDF